MKVLIVIDMQNDFVYGPLGNLESRDIIPVIQNKINDENYEFVIFTQDTHNPTTYPSSLEGINVPEHCMVETSGWKVISKLDIPNAPHITKDTFGYLTWNVKNLMLEDADIIELCGVCTDICVISNALILRALFPNTRIVVDSAACAGTSIEAHEAALKVMKNCLIEVK